MDYKFLSGNRNIFVYSIGKLRKIINFCFSFTSPPLSLFVWFFFEFLVFVSLSVLVTITVSFFPDLTKQFDSFFSTDIILFSVAFFLPYIFVVAAVDVVALSFFGSLFYRNLLQKKLYMRLNLYGIFRADIINIKT